MVSGVLKGAAGIVWGAGAAPVTGIHCVRGALQARVTCKQRMCRAMAASAAPCHGAPSCPSAPALVFAIKCVTGGCSIAVVKRVERKLQGHEPGLEGQLQHACKGQLQQQSERQLQALRLEIEHQLRESRKLVSSSALLTLQRSIFAILLDQPEACGGDGSSSCQQQQTAVQKVQPSAVELVEECKEYYESPFIGFFFREPGLAATADHCLGKKKKVGRLCKFVCLHVIT